MQEIGQGMDSGFGNQSFEEFVSLARMSMKSVHNYLSTIQSIPSWNVPYDGHVAAPNPPLTERKNMRITPIKLEPNRDGTRVVAIDASILGLGETQCGILYAIRGTVVSKEGRRYRYSRLGPLLFHINVGEITITNMNSPGDCTILSMDNGRTSPTNVCGRLLAIFETMLKMQATKNFSNAVLLWDGTLTVPAIEEDIRLANVLMQSARERANSIMGLSKKTCLFSLQATGRTLQKHSGPCLLDIDCLLNRTQRLLQLGRVYVAKLASNGLSFRLDIDRELPETERVVAVERIMGNDLTQDGYPETLRLAHIFSKFNSTEVIGMHRFLNEEYGLRILEYPNIRRILFGPFAGNLSKEPDAAYAKPI